MKSRPSPTRPGGTRAHGDLYPRPGEGDTLPLLPRAYQAGVDAPGGRGYAFKGSSGGCRGFPLFAGNLAACGVRSFRAAIEQDPEGVVDLVLSLMARVEERLAGELAPKQPLPP
jgi:hypothetical protein